VEQAPLLFSADYFAIVARGNFPDQEFAAPLDFGKLSSADSSSGNSGKT
jgi:hypothetical protein